jgi:hypothetical protein
MALLFTRICSRFLDEIDRLAAARYTPTDADILRARVRTFGVTEHEFKIDQVTYK